MKVHYLALAILPALATSALAAEGDVTLGLGYTSVNAPGFSDMADIREKQLRGLGTGDVRYTGNGSGSGSMSGIYVHFRHELTDTWGYMATFGYAEKSGNTHGTRRDDDKKIDYSSSAQFVGSHLSLQVGPTVRFTNWLSAYTLAGINLMKYSSDVNATYLNGDGDNHSSSYSGKKTAYGYTAGLQFNILDGLTIDTAYQSNLAAGEWKASGFRVGVGFKF